MLSAKKVIGSLEKNRGMLKNYSVKEIGLFGSVASGKNTSKSDLDFIVDFFKPSFDNYMDLKFALEKMFGCEVDLVTKKSLKPELKSILDDVIYAKAN